MPKSAMYSTLSFVIAGIVGLQAIWLPTLGKIICIIIAVAFAYVAGREYRRERHDT